MAQPSASLSDVRCVWLFRSHSRSCTVSEYTSIRNSLLTDVRFVISHSLAANHSRLKQTLACTGIFFMPPSKMAQQVHETFVGLSHNDFAAHADAMVSNSTTDSSKRQAIAYLSKVLSLDQKTLNTERKTLKNKRYAQRRRETKVAELHDALEFDFSKTPALFTAQQHRSIRKARRAAGLFFVCCSRA